VNQTNCRGVYALRRVSTCSNRLLAECCRDFSASRWPDHERKTWVGMVWSSNIRSNDRSNTILSGIALVSSPLVFFIYA